MHTQESSEATLDAEKIRVLHALAQHPDQSPCDALRLDQYLGRHALEIAAALESHAALTRERHDLRPILCRMIGHEEDPQAPATLLGLAEVCERRMNSLTRELDAANAHAALREALEACVRFLQAYRPAFTYQAERDSERLEVKARAALKVTP